MEINLSSDEIIEVPVLIAGGGPVGLVLGHELEHHGIDALLIERNPTTTIHPKMDVTNGRSMELFRRLGIAEELRSHSVASDHPLSVIWATRLAEWELARFDYPSVDEMRREIRDTNDGTMPLEPDMRVSQVILEPALKSILVRDGKHVDIKFGWKFESFEQDEDGVLSVISHPETGLVRKVRSKYLVGCDGGGSTVRRGLGIELHDLPVRDLFNQAGGTFKNLWHMAKNLARGIKPFDGRMYIIHFTSPEKDFFERFGTAWHIQAPNDGTIISQNDKDTWTIHIPLRVGMDADALDPKQVLFSALGKEIECEIIVHNYWKPRLAMAEGYGSKRVWLAGDACHQVIPTGGYGMNTGVGDAVDIGWKLAATLNGWAGSELLKSYEAERMPIGHRNRAASSRHASIRMKISHSYKSVVHQTGTKAERARADLGRLIADLGNLENEALGIELGYRYDKSPVICHENSDPPPYHWEQYSPSTWPGQRPPSVYLDDGRAIFDTFSTGFTLLRFADLDASAIEEAAKNIGLPLRTLDIRDELATKLYERKLVLLRPDHHVAWRGNTTPADVRAILDKVRGVGSAASEGN